MFLCFGVQMWRQKHFWSQYSVIFYNICISFHWRLAPEQSWNSEYETKILCQLFLLLIHGFRIKSRQRDLVREKISSKKNERQGEMPYKRLIDFSSCLFEARCAFKRCFSFLDSIKEIWFYNRLIIYMFLDVIMTHKLCQNGKMS